MVLADLGGRIRQLRVTRGMTQAELGGSVVSASYISLLESGLRKASPEVLEHLASRLGVPLSALYDPQEQILRLRHAQLALETGEYREASRSFTELMDDPSLSDRDRRHARWGLARALEAMGDLPSAVEVLESLYSDGPAPGGPWLEPVVALARCYREIGDLGRSIDLGERALGELADDASDDLTLRLVVTLAAAYFERGDLARASSLLSRSLEAAEQVSDPGTRASALWNASIVAAGRGQTREAVRLAERALALLGESDRPRAIAGIRLTYAWLLLRSSPDSTAQVRPLLDRTLADLERYGTPVEVSYCLSEYANCAYAEGDVSGALDATTRALELLPADAHMARAQIGALHGAFLAASGSVDEAWDMVSEAARTLGSSSAGRLAAEAWAGLAEAYDRAERRDMAMAAYRESAACLGITPVTPPPRGLVLKDEMASLIRRDSRS